MKLEHVAIYTNNLERLKAFYVKYFKATANNKYHNPKTNLQTYFLEFTDGARLEIMQRPDIMNAHNEGRTGITHIAFKVEGNDNVDRITQQLTADGYKLKSPPRNTGDGYYESCVYDGSADYFV